jgi:hypothetical protein
MTTLKTGVVKGCYPTDREPDVYGNKSFNIIFEDKEANPSGLFVGKKSEYFRPGATVFYLEEKRVSQNTGADWIKVSIPKQDKKPEGKKASDPERDYRIMKTVALKAAVQTRLLLHGEPVKINEVLKTYNGWLILHNDEEYHSIAAQSALVQAVLLTQDINFGINTIEDILKIAEQFYEYIIKPKQS